MKFIYADNDNFGKAINEVRKEQGLDPIEGGEARLPSNILVAFCKEDDFRRGKDGIFRLGVDMVTSLEDGDTIQVIHEESGIEQVGTVHLQTDGSFQYVPKEDK